VAGAFRADGIEDSDADAVAPAIADRGVDAALAYARRKRLGPYGDPGRVQGDDRAVRQKQLAAMIRAGHSFELARKILAAPAADDFDPADFA
jgi:regulatory protein